MFRVTPKLLSTPYSPNFNMPSSIIQIDGLSVQYINPHNMNLGFNFSNWKYPEYKFMFFGPGMLIGTDGNNNVGIFRLSGTMFDLERSISNVKSVILYGVPQSFQHSIAVVTQFDGTKYAGSSQSSVYYEPNYNNYPEPSEPTIISERIEVTHYYPIGYNEYGIMDGPSFFPIMNINPTTFQLPYTPWNDMTNTPNTLPQSDFDEYLLFRQMPPKQPKTPLNFPSTWRPKPIPRRSVYIYQRDPSNPTVREVIQYFKKYLLENMVWNTWGLVGINLSLSDNINDDLYSFLLDLLDREYAEEGVEDVQGFINDVVRYTPQVIQLLALRGAFSLDDVIRQRYSEVRGLRASSENQLNSNTRDSLKSSSQSSGFGSSQGSNLEYMVNKENQAGNAGAAVNNGAQTNRNTDVVNLSSSRSSGKSVNESAAKSKNLVNSNDLGNGSSLTGRKSANRLVSESSQTSQAQNTGGDAITRTRLSSGKIGERSVSEVSNQTKNQRALNGAALPTGQRSVVASHLMPEQAQDGLTGGFPVDEQGVPILDGSYVNNVTQSNVGTDIASNVSGTNEVGLGETNAATSGSTVTNSSESDITTNQLNSNVQGTSNAGSGVTNNAVDSGSVTSQAGNKASGSGADLGVGNNASVSQNAGEVSNRGNSKGNDSGIDGRTSKSHNALEGSVEGVHKAIIGTVSNDSNLNSGLSMGQAETARNTLQRNQTNAANQGSTTSAIWAQQLQILRNTIMEMDVYGIWIYKFDYLREVI